MAMDLQAGATLASCERTREQEHEVPKHPGNIYIPGNQTISNPERQEQRLSSSSQNSRSSTIKHENLPPVGPPPLSFSPWTKRTSIILCSFGILFFDLVLPCTLYYTIKNYTDLSLSANLGISCAILGLGELFELPLRAWRLYRNPEQYGPLGQTSKWGFDFLLWWYLVATVIGFVLYLMSVVFDNPIKWLFLFSPGFIAGWAVLTAAISAFPFRLPFRVSSDGKGERCKPFVYYVIEDFIAVDAGQKKRYRQELKERWNASPVFRRLLWDVNIFWVAGGLIFIGVLAAITWACEFEIAFGLSFGILFVWIGMWAAATWGWVRLQLSKEKYWFVRSSDLV